MVSIVLLLPIVGGVNPVRSGGILFNDLTCNVKFQQHFDVHNSGLKHLNGSVVIQGWGIHL